MHVAGTGWDSPGGGGVSEKNHCSDSSCEFQPNKSESKRSHVSVTPTHAPRANPFTPRLSSTPQVPRPQTTKKIRITKSHDRATMSAAAKRFSKTANLSNMAKMETLDCEDVGGYELGMDWGRCDDGNWGDGEAKEGVGGGSGDCVKPGSDVVMAWDNWGDDVDGGETEGTVAKEENREPVVAEEEKTVV